MPTDSLGGWIRNLHVCRCGVLRRERARLQARIGLYRTGARCTLMRVHTSQ
jgi:hypothetical protein